MAAKNVRACRKVIYLYIYVVNTVSAGTYDKLKCLLIYIIICSGKHERVPGSLLVPVCNLSIEKPMPWLATFIWIVHGQ